jgi:threonine-phosphate decarboxylase
MADPVKKPEHGGDIVGMARRLGVTAGDLLDFSASINPLGISPAVLNAARAALSMAVHYPEIDAASLVEAISRFHDIPQEHFLPGAGSTPLLYLLPRVLRPRRALLVTPCFGEYARGLALAGVPFDTYPLSAADSFRLDPDRLLGTMDHRCDLVVLANPGNPTGIAMPPKAIEEIARGLSERGAVAVDEAFIDFCPHLSVIDQVPRYDNLFVFRSLTKFYAIPGLRAGYLAGSAAMISRLSAASEPWTLSTPALEGAKAALAAEAFRRETLTIIPVLRHHLAMGLQDLGLTVFPSQANYLLVRLGESGRTAFSLAEALLSHHILIRECSGFPPLDERFMRVAVRTAEENERLLSVLRDILS